MANFVYLSWGGTGRTASLRKAIERVQQESSQSGSEVEHTLTYLALLDNDSFSDLETSMLELVADELEWVLEAQVHMSLAQVGGEEIPIDLLVQYGGVVEEVTKLVNRTEVAEILVGAPVPVAGHNSVAELISAIQASTGRPTSLVEAADA